MQRIVRILIVLSVPLMLFGVVRQAGACREARVELAGLVETQRELLELERKLSAGISVLGARSRLEAAAEGSLGLERAVPERAIRIEVTGARGKTDG